MTSHESPLKQSQKSYNSLLIVLGSFLFLLFPIFTSPDFTWSLAFTKVVGFQKSFFSYCLALVLFFINVFWLIPYFFKKKRYWIYGFWVCVFSIGFAFVPDRVFLPSEKASHRAPHAQPHEHKSHKSNFATPHKNNIPHSEDIILYIFVTIIGVLMFIHERYKSEQEQKVAMELAYLKAQINPHFLFNTLNSIYALVLKKDGKAPDAIVQLSNLMRYALEDNQSNKIELDKELGFIQDYIALQKLRFHSDLNLALHLPTHLKGKIAPMMLLPFIENAFKYGANPEQNGNIKIELTTKESSLLVFKCFNQKMENANSFVWSETNIGIQNTIARLESIYGNQYQLNIDNSPTHYCITLQIPI